MSSATATTPFCCAVTITCASAIESSISCLVIICCVTTFASNYNKHYLID